MEDIDIENLDFDAYNREIYLEKENQYKSPINDNLHKVHKDALKKFKLEIDSFVEQYKRANKLYEENINQKEENEI